MTYKKMPVNDLVVLYEKLYNVGEIDNGLRVKLNPEGQIYYYKGDYKSHSYPDFSIYFETGESQKVEAFELYVQMTYQTYNLHKLVDDADYELALAVYEQYFGATPDSEEGRFAYLLSLIIGDYEAEHYPTAIASTASFINYLLEERGLTWLDLRDALGYAALNCTEAYMRYMFERDNARVVDVVKLSHFFLLPVQAFIIGGYGE